MSIWNRSPSWSSNKTGLVVEVVGGKGEGGDKVGVGYARRVPDTTNPTREDGTSLLGGSEMVVDEASKAVLSVCETSLKQSMARFRSKILTRLYKSPFISKHFVPLQRSVLSRFRLLFSKLDVSGRNTSQSHPTTPSSLLFGTNSTGEQAMAPMLRRSFMACGFLDEPKSVRSVLGSD